MIQKLQSSLPNTFNSYVNKIAKLPNYSVTNINRITSMARAIPKNIPNSINMYPNISALINPIVSQLTSVAKTIGITNRLMISSLASITKISDGVSFSSSLLAEFSKIFLTSMINIE